METTQNAPSEGNQVTVDGVKQPPSKKHFKIKKPRRRAIIGFAGVAVLLAGIATAGYLLIYKPVNDYVIKVGNVIYSRAEYTDLISQAKQDGVDGKSALNIITKAAKYRQAADITGLKKLNGMHDYVSNERYGKNYDQLNEWQKHQIDFILYPKYIQLYKRGGYEAVKIDVAFNKLFIMREPGVPGNVDNFGNLEEITKYRNEAKQFIEDLHQAVVSKKMTPTNALEKRLDSKEYEYWSGGSSSEYMFVSDSGVIFNTTQDEYSLDEATRKRVAELKDNDVTPITEVKQEIIHEMIANGYEYDGVAGYSFLAKETTINKIEDIEKDFNDAVENITVEVRV